MKSYLYLREICGNNLYEAIKNNPTSKYKLEQDICNKNNQ